MLRWGMTEIAETLDELVDPSTSGLIMWDYAKGLVSRAFNVESFVRHSAELAAAARECGVPVFYARQSDVTWPEIGGGLIRMRMKPISAEKIARVESVNRPDTPEGEFIEAVKPQAGDVIFNKFMPSGFLGTDLEWRLRSRGIKTLVMAGISLATGVNGTAREALNRGFYAVIVRDAVSATSAGRFERSMAVCEELHDVFDTAEVASSWRAARAKHR